jgi:dihydropyrimidinase
MKTLIINGIIVGESENLKADLLIVDEKISKIETEINAGRDTKIIDATGMLVLPGGVDAHVHLNLPMFGTVSSDDHYTGTKAAAFGGTTTILDFISQDTDDLKENFLKLKEYYSL